MKNLDSNAKCGILKHFLGNYNFLISRLAVLECFHLNMIFFCLIFQGV
jgi:hypothetical protein